MLAVAWALYSNLKPRPPAACSFPWTPECELLKGHSLGAWASGDAPSSHGYWEVLLNSASSCCVSCTWHWLPNIFYLPQAFPPPTVRKTESVLKPSLPSWFCVHYCNCLWAFCLQSVCPYGAALLFFSKCPAECILLLLDGCGSPLTHRPGPWSACHWPLWKPLPSSDCSACSGSAPHTGVPSDLLPQVHALPMLGLRPAFLPEFFLQSLLRRIVDGPLKSLLIHDVFKPTMRWVLSNF